MLGRRARRSVERDEEPVALRRDRDGVRVLPRAVLRAHPPEEQVELADFLRVRALVPGRRVGGGGGGALGGAPGGARRAPRAVDVEALVHAGRAGGGAGRAPRARAAPRVSVAADARVERVAVAAARSASGTPVGRPSARRAPSRAPRARARARCSRARARVLLVDRAARARRRARRRRRGARRARAATRPSSLPGACQRCRRRTSAATRHGWGFSCARAVAAAVARAGSPP